MTIFSRFLVLSLLATAFASAALAEDYEDPIEGSVTGDYNIGGAIGVSHAQGGRSATDVLTGAMANAELVVSGPLSDKHFVILDARALVFLGGGAQVAGNGAPMALFSLRLIGSVAGGLMAYKVIPANIAFEDLDLRVRNDQVDGSLLLGTTIYVPINLLTRMEQTNLYIAVTPGLRYNSIGNEAAFGFQTKVRYATEKVSAELRWLMTVASRTQEMKGVAQVGVNHLFMERDQLGLYFGRGVVTDPMGSVIDITEAMLFYGGTF